jgi:hypothetical protein
MTDMHTSIFLARLLGPLFLLPGIGILINPRVFRALATEVVRSVTLIYLFGLVDFAGGLAIVLNHNVWTLSWPLIVTLIGWALLIRGAVRVAVPDLILGYVARYIANKRVYPFTGAAAVILGLVLCYFGFRA